LNNTAFIEMVLDVLSDASGAEVVPATGVAGPFDCGRHDVGVGRASVAHWLAWLEADPADGHLGKRGACPAQSKLVAVLVLKKTG